MQASLFDDDAPPCEPAKPTAGKAKNAPPPLPDGFAEPVERPATFPPFVRQGVAADLADVVAEHAAGTMTADELYRYVKGALYLLTGAELASVARAVSTLLRDQP